MHILRSADHRIVPWANGLGITADVVLSPPPPDEWTWRLSIADVTDDVPFSIMAGIDRHIVVAQGVGMALRIDGRPEVRMDRATPPLPFDGDATTTCRLLDGPIADLNLMVRRSEATGSLRVVRLRDGDVFTAAFDDVAIVVLDGEVNVAGSVLSTFDALHFDGASPAATSITATTSAELAVAAIRPSVTH